MAYGLEARLDREHEGGTQVKVEEVMTTDVVSVAPEAPLKEVAAIMLERGISGLPVIDAAGKTIIPGLVDSHVHLRNYHVQDYLYWGVTTVGDLGNSPGWLVAYRDAIAQGRMPGSYVLVGGNRFNAPLRPEFVNEMNDFMTGNAGNAVITDIEAAEREVEYAKKIGQDGIKMRDRLTPEMMKTIIAPGLKSRMLGLNGWFSTNILGNRDGEVLDDPDSFKTKEESKLSVLDQILQPDLYPDLYKDFTHKVRIHYYPPRGDNKEGWDNIDIYGWLGYPMQIKINFLCRDSILAAPIVLDLVLFLDLSQRCGMRGIQEWLSFYFKSPMCAAGLYPEHDLFIQLMKLKNTLRYLKGEDLITHLGMEYYD